MSRREFPLGCFIVGLLAVFLVNPAMVCAEELVQLNVENLSRRAIIFGIATEARAAEDKWTKIQLNPRQRRHIDLESPDDFALCIEYGRDTYISGPVALKKFIQEHPKFVLEVSAEMEQLSEGAPGQGNKPKYRTVFKASAKRPGSGGQDSLNMTLYKK